MTEIPRYELKNHFGKVITMKENGKDNKIVLEKSKGGWLCGMSITNHSAIQIFIHAKQDEHSPKYFIE